MPVHLYRDGRLAKRDDLLVTEEPLEIRIAAFRGPSHSVSVTMRTPGHDFELAAGFLHGEGILVSHEQVGQIAYCRDVGRVEQRYNIVTVELRPGLTPDLSPGDRYFGMTSACGICGKASLEALRRRGLEPIDDDVRVPPETLLRFPAALREAQSVFEKTGGLHAAALFDAAGRIVTLREDVGRHNAVDKIVGERFLAGKLPLRGYVLMVSGRPGFEIVQKAVAAGIPILAGVSAPSSLAVQTAHEFGMTLVGFLRDDRFNVYAGIDRLASA